jgi:23S rRNA G2069 N7-methylase RlmK/C1962 C5-methylase RlmI
MKTPLSDKESIEFLSFLSPLIKARRWLNLFARDGAVSTLALRLGAAHCISIDVDQKNVDSIRKNVPSVNHEVRCTDSFLYIKSTNKTFDAIYLAPPSTGSSWIEIINLIAEHSTILTPHGSVIAHVEPHQYEKKELVTLMERSKFTLRQNTWVQYCRRDLNK